MLRLLRVHRILLVMTFSLIALGGAVRAMDAGLACPDWPLCFGDVIPDYHPQVYFEFIHRALAGCVAIISVGLAIVIFRRPDSETTDRWLMGFALVLLLSQIILGGLTVILQLHDKVVTAHLAFGSGFLVTMFWLYWRLRGHLFPHRFTVAARWAWMAVALVVIVYVQILLGGLVASNYAALVCAEWPTCHGQWIPTLKGAIGLQVIHRLWAYLTALSILAVALYARFGGAPREFSRVTGWMTLLVFLQIGIGVANVLLYTPALITVAHLATGVGILILGARGVYVVRLGFLKAQNLAASPVRPSRTPLGSYSAQTLS